MEYFKDMKTLEYLAETEKLLKMIKVKKEALQPKKQIFISSKMNNWNQFEFDIYIENNFL